MSTTSDLITYYSNLLILQYAQKIRAVATIKALVTPVIMAEDLTNQLPLSVQNAFNLIGSNTAVGVQLDVLGKYAGVTRTGNGFYGPITLNDSDFLVFIQLAIVTNSAGSSLATIQQLLFQYFPDEILVFDYADMHMSYLIDSSVGSQALAQLFVAEGLLPKPMGVALASTIYYPGIKSFFGFRTYRLPAHNASPFNTYTSYVTTWPWLSYAYAVGAVISPVDTPVSLLTESGLNRLVQEDGSLLFIN